MIEKLVIFGLITFESIGVSWSVSYLEHEYFKINPRLGVYNQKAFAATDQLLIYPIPQKNNEADFLSSAKSVAIYDVKSNIALFENNANEKLLIASLTKLATAGVILKKHSLDETVNVANIPALTPETMGLFNGESISVLDLLHGLLIGSANDAAYALAHYSSGSVQNFVDEMNQFARDLKLSNTHFTNPAGFDDAGNYSTARDLSQLTRYLLKNKTFREIVSKKEYRALSNDQKTVHNIKSTNLLLGNQEIFGVKTGKTPLAGECLVALSKKGENEILTVVINAPDRFGETQRMIKWAFDSYQWN